MTTDRVEHEVPDINRARQVMNRHMPLHADRLERWKRQTEDQFGPEFSELIDHSASAIAICLARMVLRNGSASPLHRYFHDEQHPFDLMMRLRRLYQCSPASLSGRDYLALGLFTAGHDLRQDLGGLDADGVGCNERESADELIRVLEAVGLDRAREPDLHRILPPMIHGTTYRPAGFEYAGRKYPGGVLAPALVEELVGQGAQAATSTDRHLHRLTLIATDIDTGNVADPFDLFADRGVRLCRELYLLNGQAELDTTTANGVYSFVTREQERYFFVLQRFHVPETRDCFGPSKEANAVKLKALIAAIRQLYEQKLMHSEHGISGEQIVRSYLDVAGTL